MGMTMKTAAINHDVEHMLTATTGHDHGCWEEFAERIIERTRADVAGRHDDVIDGLTIWEHYEREILIDGGDCDCDLGEEAAA